MMRFACIVLCFLLAVASGANAANAQETARALIVQDLKLPAPFTREKATEMLSSMDDAQARRLLSDVLYGLAYVPKAQETSSNPVIVAVAKLQEVTGGIAFSIRDLFVRAPKLAMGFGTAYTNFVERFGGWTIMVTALIVAGALAAGLAAEYLFDRFGRPAVARLVPDVEASTGLVPRLVVLGARLLLELAGLFIFFIVVHTITSRAVAAEMAPTVATLLVNLLVVPRLTASLARVLLSPRRPELRLVNADDGTAKFIHRSLVWIVAFQGLGNFLTYLFADNHVPLRSTRIDTWLVTITLIWLAIIVWRSRAGLTQIVLGWDPPAKGPTRLVARHYPHLLLAMLAGGWLLVNYLSGVRRFDLLQQGSHFSTMALLAVSPIVDAGIRAMSKHLTPPMTGEGPIAMRAFEANKGAFVRIGRLLLVVFLALALGAIWKFDFGSLVDVGGAFSALLLKAFAVVAAGYMAWEVAMLLINRQLSREMASTANAQDEDGDAMGGGGGSRLATVLPLVRIGANIAIVVLTLLLALGQVGIDIAPLLAGAGIVGLAIGFGAQTLVKDIVSGLFFLIDDAFRVGDYITVGGTAGTVEKISLRSMQLRHHEGIVHTIPYGEVAQVSNFSRDWVIVKLKFTVAFDTDIKKVKKIFKAIGADIMTQPFAEDIIETFKLQGVGDVNDVGVVIRGKFKAKPGKQWVARKEIYARVHRAFEENGIEFARREVRVNVGGPGAAALDDKTRQSIATAAAEAVPEPQPATKDNAGILWPT